MKKLLFTLVAIAMCCLAASAAFLDSLAGLEHLEP